MKPELKKLLVLNLPYLLFVYLFAKCGQAYRLAAGADASAKLLHLTNGISAAFASPLPSLHPFDLCVGVAGAIWGCMGYTVLLCFCLFKTGSISKSVFGAH